jgi:hypothetical protein
MFFGSRVEAVTMIEVGVGVGVEIAKAGRIPLFLQVAFEMRGLAVLFAL